MLLAEVAAYLKKVQASQEDIDRKDQANRLDLQLEARMLGKAGQEQVSRCARHLNSCYGVFSRHFLPLVTVSPLF